MDRIDVFLQTRDLYSWTRDTVAALQNMELANITILDNGSTQLDLLKWYDQLCPVPVVRLPNLGHLAVWKLNLEKYCNGYYVICEPYLDLSNVPDNVLVIMRDVLEVYQEVSQVSLSLRLDDIPDNLPGARGYQMQFWEPYRKRFYAGQFDTYFGCYRVGWRPGQHGVHIRLPAPYQARHLPWYTFGSWSEEELYYLQNANQSSNTAIAAKQYYPNLF